MHLVLLLNMKTSSMGYLFGHLGSNVPAVSLPNFLHTTGVLFEEGWEKRGKTREILGGKQELFSNCQNMVVLSNLF